MGKKKLFKILIIFVLFGGIFCWFLFGAKTLKKPFVLENLCPPKESLPGALLKPPSIVEYSKGEMKIFESPKYSFTFQLPEKQWYFHEKIIQEYEEPLTSPQAEYSLYFSHPVDNINPYHWEANQRAALRFLVFKNYCQNLNNWIELIPGSSKAEKEDFVVDGHPGIRLRYLRGYKDNEMVIFNKGDYHYQFQLMVRYPEDLPYYSEILTQTIKNFRFSQS